MSQKSYKGLGNIGAICYINSFIQTLFMTPEFRDGIYSWTYNQKLHPKREDSIPFQLQKLFGKLELSCNETTTRELIKSFQWHDDEAFNQQDIQQFNRILFQALQKSLYNGKQGKQLIKQLYEGELIHFTKCLQCHNESVREQNFQDIILIIKNIYEKIYSDSVELSLQRYIKPELLDQNNLYDCSYCQKKVRAQRGVKFIKLPKFMNIVLQRFHFDYETFTRNKINDKFVFPFVLNFNNYFNGYEQIPNKLNEDSSDYFVKEEYKAKQPAYKPSVKLHKFVSKNGTTSTQPAVAGKVKTKPSANTKSFLQEMRKKKMQQSLDNDDLVFVSGNSTIQNEIKPEPADTKTTSTQQLNHQQVNGSKGVINHIPQDIPPPPPISIFNSLETPTLSVSYTSQALKTNGITDLSIQKEIETLHSDKQQLEKQKMQKWNEQKQKNQDLIHQYLKDGPLVYQLYSILVHSGTANAGHYFTYIKSQENDKWYLFNDERVNEINITEIQKTFGGNGLSSAYVLYYRLHQEQKFKMEYRIPQYILKSIKEQQASKQQRIIQKHQNLENILILKIYFQLGVKSIEIHKSSTLGLLFEKCKELFNIKIISDYSQAKLNDTSTYIKEGNLRIRLFNPVNDTKLDTYTSQYEKTLTEIGIRSYQNFLLEIKADSQEFEQFVQGFMSIRVALWEDNTNVLSLDEKNIKLHKVSIGRKWTMKQVQELIKAKRNQFLTIEQDQNICIIKRHQNDEFLYHQIVNLQEYHSKTVDQVGIFEAEIVFIEKDGDNLNWPRQFENEIHRISIKIINSSTLESQNIITDSRITLFELKNTLCALINQQPEETIVRRGNKSGLELKNIQATLKDNRFISGTTLYLQKGIPAKMGEIRIQLFLASDASNHLYNRLHQFQFIADVPIDTAQKASEIKKKFIDILQKTRSLELTPEGIRIREKVNDKMGKIYRQKPMKEQQIIEKRQIAVEIIQDKLDLKDYSIYVRLWDQYNWKLSQKYELLVNKNTTMKTLSMQIYELAKLNGLSTIEPEEMDICRILSIHKFNIIDLVDMEYFGMISDTCVLGQPLFVNSDGLLYIVKQTGIEPRELTKEEEELFGGKIKIAVKPTRGRAAQPPSQNAKKQKGIVIRVVQKVFQVQQIQEEK